MTDEVLGSGDVAAAALVRGGWPAQVDGGLLVVVAIALHPGWDHGAAADGSDGTPA